MKQLDYYTVMESRIIYFSKKYDPLNKLGTVANPVVREKKTSAQPPVKKFPVKKKIIKGLDSVIAIFL
jgi:hypothetical protein